MGRTSPDGLTLIKLGGSLLTDKSAVESLRAEVLERIAREVAAASLGAPGRLILGHGSGSFGHAEALRRGLSGGAVVAAAPGAVAAVHAAAARLHRMVLKALRDAGAHPLSFPPSCCLVAEGGGSGSWDPGPLLAALAARTLPVVYGDIVLDPAGGARICSTEDALVAVARSLRASGRRILRAVWLGVTDGVLDARGVRIAHIAHGADRPARTAGAAVGADVTGGMAHRVARALDLAATGVPSWIGDGRKPGVLRAVLAGEESGGTWVLPAQSTQP